MKIHFATFLFALTTRVEAGSLRGKHTSDQNSMRRLQRAQILDLEEFVKARATGAIGGRLMPNGAEFVELDTETLNIKLLDETMKLGSLNTQESDPISVDRVTHNNQGFQEQSYELSLSGTVSREFTASVTAGFRYQQTYEASVGFSDIAEVSTSTELEFSLETTASTTESVEETVSSTLPLIIPPYTRIQATQLINTIVSSPSFTVDVEITGTTVERACNPGTFQGKKWYCENKPNVVVGNGCSTGWEECDDVQGLCNPGIFDDQRWHCEGRKDLFMGNRCDWNKCQDHSRGTPGICYYYNDSSGEHIYACQSIFDIFLIGSADHSFTFTPTADRTIHYTARGQFTGVGGRDYWVDIDYECLSPWVLTSDGLCVPPSEAEAIENATDNNSDEPETASLTVVASEPYRKERLILDERGNLVEMVDMIN